MLIVKALLALLSCATIVCILHYFYSASFSPEAFVARNTTDTMSTFAWVYFIVVLFGSGSILFAGFDSILSWLPSSWGSIDEDGDFVPIRRTISGILVFFCLPLFSYIDRSVREHLANEQLRERVRTLESQLRDAMHNIPPAT